MSNESYKELLAQVAQVEAQIREHHIIMVRRIVAGLSTSDNRRQEVKPKMDKLDQELSNIVRDYDAIDNLVDYIMYKLGVEN